MWARGNGFALMQAEKSVRRRLYGNREVSVFFYKFWVVEWKKLVGGVRVRTVLMMEIMQECIRV